MDRRHFLRALSALGFSTLPRCGGDDPISPSEAAVVLSKSPWLQVIAPRAVRLRFETRIAEAVPVVVTAEGGALELTPTLTTRELTFERTAFEGQPDYIPDEAGFHTVQEVRIEDLEPGATYGYRIDADEVVEGSFVAPPAAGTAHRVGWLSDTSWPFSKESVALLEAQPPDLFVHGGDLQYQTSPLDTWNGLSHSLSAITSRALAHMIVGNHEFEDQNEVEQMYDRLYGGQGEEGDTTRRYFAFTFGGLRWICLDSESSDLASDTTQLAWLEQELAQAASSGDILQSVVAFHRPLYTLSKHFPGSTATRDVLHPLFVQHGVRLVLSGHAHCYERFVVDEVSYVVDGGGGATLYDPNEDRDEADRTRPGESDLRVVVSESYGATTLDIDESGTIALTRSDTDGGITDQVDIPVP